MLTYFLSFVPLCIIHTVLAWHLKFSCCLLWKEGFFLEIQQNFELAVYLTKVKRNKISVENSYDPLFHQVLFLCSSLKEVKPIITSLLRENVRAYEKVIWFIRSISASIQTLVYRFGRLNYVTKLQKNWFKNISHLIKCSAQLCLLVHRHLV